MKVVILCGGDGIRLKNSLEFIPKAMVKIGHRPLLWHVMKIYAKYGFNDFVLALGKDGDKIRDYFLNYDHFANDISITLGTGDIKINSQHQENEWTITMVDTGELAGTGARLARCKKYLDKEKFFLAYSDCLANIHIDKLLDYHNESNKIATVSGINPSYRYGEFEKIDGEIISWNEISKLSSRKGGVNGGFMVFENSIFEYVNSLSECILEKEVFANLVKNKQIDIYEHEGFWQSLDNDRECNFLNELCEKNSEYWLIDK